MEATPLARRVAAAAAALAVALAVAGCGGEAGGTEPAQLAGLQLHPLWDGVEDGSYFYFVHSYYVAPEVASDTIGEADYGGACGVKLIPSAETAARVRCVRYPASPW